MSSQTSTQVPRQPAAHDDRRALRLVLDVEAVVDGRHLLTACRSRAPGRRPTARHGDHDGVVVGRPPEEASSCCGARRPAAGHGPDRSGRGRPPRRSCRRAGPRRPLVRRQPVDHLGDLIGQLGPADRLDHRLVQRRHGTSASEPTGSSGSVGSIVERGVGRRRATRRQRADRPAPFGLDDARQHHRRRSAAARSTAGRRDEGEDDAGRPGDQSRGRKRRPRGRGPASGRPATGARRAAGPTNRICSGSSVARFSTAKRSESTDAISTCGQPLVACHRGWAAAITSDDRAAGHEPRGSQQVPAPAHDQPDQQRHGEEHDEVLVEDGQPGHTADGDPPPGVGRCAASGPPATAAPARRRSRTWRWPAGGRHRG